MTRKQLDLRKGVRKQGLRAARVSGELDGRRPGNALRFAGCRRGGCVALRRMSRWKAGCKDVLLPCREGWPWGTWGTSRKGPICSRWLNPVRVLFPCSPCNGASRYFCSRQADYSGDSRIGRAAAHSEMSRTSRATGLPQNAAYASMVHQSKKNASYRGRFRSYGEASAPKGALE
jgi:hypothetical protein